MLNLDLFIAKKDDSTHSAINGSSRFSSYCWFLLPFCFLENNLDEKNVFISFGRVRIYLPVTIDSPTDALKRYCLSQRFPAKRQIDYYSAFLEQPINLFYASREKRPHEAE